MKKAETRASSKARGKRLIVNHWAAQLAPARTAAEWVTIDDDWPDSLVAIAFLAILAYPEDVKARDAFVYASRTFLLTDYIDRGGDATKVQERFRCYSPNLQRDLYERGKIHMAWHLISSRRLPAAEIASAFLLKSVPGATVRFHGTPLRDRSSAVKASARAMKRNRGRAHGHTRIWKESEPVLHLGLALQSAVSSIEGKVSAHRLLRNPDWARAAMKSSEDILFCLTRIAALRAALHIEECKAVRFRIK